MKNLTLFTLLLLLPLVFATCSSQQEKLAAKEVTIVVKADQTVLLEDKVVTLEELGEQLKSLAQKNELTVTVKPEADVEMGFLQNVQKVLQSEKIGNVSFNGEFK